VSDHAEGTLTARRYADLDDRVRRSDEPRVHRVGIGEFVVSSNIDDALTTIALGSCVAVCLWEPAAKVGGILHFMLPDARLNSERARLQPAAFADTGIPLLFRAAYELGAQKKRCVVRLVGGAELAATRPEGSESIFDVGRRNVLAARGVLWRNGILVNGELVGGTAARTILMAVADGRVVIKTDGQIVAEL
jgi:chemotaxis protein CheD